MSNKIDLATYDLSNRPQIIPYGNKVLLIGTSGSGKTRSLMNLDYQKTMIIQPNNKELSFYGANRKYILGKNLLNTNIDSNFATLLGLETALDLVKAQIIKSKENYLASKDSKQELVLQNLTFNTVVIEDFTHYLNDHVISNANDKGYDKWLSLAKNAFDAVIGKIRTFPPEVNIILIGHLGESVSVNNEKELGLETQGNMLSKINLESYFTTTLIAKTIVKPSNVENDNGVLYKFQTNRTGNGNLRAKSPEGTFELLIDNCLNFVLQEMTYYKLGYPTHEMKRNHTKYQGYLG